jgi:anti-sigma factor RsiW
MGAANSRKEACRRARKGLDAHVSGELDSVAERETRGHMKDCAACAALLEERLRVRELLRRAVRGVEAPAHLSGAVRAMMRQG